MVPLELRFLRATQLPRGHRLESPTNLCVVLRNFRQLLSCLLLLSHHNSLKTKASPVKAPIRYIVVTRRVFHPLIQA